jgi:hypothetical protein
MARGGRAPATLAALAALAACDPAAEPRFAATCAPDTAMEQVTCRIHNHGKQAGRACFTARVQPETGTPLVAQRMCTGVLEPGRSVEATPRFEPLDRLQRSKTVVSRCLRQGRWTCKVDVAESPDELLENQPTP